ncbi:Fc.00g105520.m01.CDS01 [Cosmosporella sp. VM-42]
MGEAPRPKFTREKRNHWPSGVFPVTKRASTPCPRILEYYSVKEMQCHADDPTNTSRSETRGGYWERDTTVNDDTKVCLADQPARDNFGRSRRSCNAARALGKCEWAILRR